jgi:hypothetical protein
MSVQTAPGGKLHLEASSSIHSPVWETIDTIIGDGTEQVLTNSLSGSTHKFYRLRVD